MSVETDGDGEDKTTPRDGSSEGIETVMFDGDEEEVVLTGDSKLGAQNQITPPAALRQFMGIESGDKVVFIATSEGRVLLGKRKKK